MNGFYDYLLGLDVGNTNIKCVAMSLSGSILTVERLPASAAFSEDGKDLAGERLMRLIIDIVKKTAAITKTRYAGAEPIAVAVSAMGCKAILLDEQKKQVFLPQNKYNSVELETEDVFRITGYHSGYENLRRKMLCASMKEEALASVRHIFPVSDYIAYRLCSTAAATYSTACSLGNIDIRRKMWWGASALLKVFPEMELPPLVESGTVIGELDLTMRKAMEIKNRVFVVSGGQDYLCAALAGRCHTGHKIMDMIGTFELLTSFTGHVTGEAKKYSIDEFWDFHVFPGIYSHTLELKGASWLEWLRSSIFSNSGKKIDEKSWSSMIKDLDDLTLSSVVPSQLVFLPDITPEEELIKAVYKIEKSYRTGKQMQVSVLSNMIQGLNLNVRRVLEEFEEYESGVSELIVMGGGARSKFWMANKADILGIPVCVPNIPEASATGAALLAGIGTGIYNGFEEASCIFNKVSSAIYQPDQERAKWWAEFYEEQFKPRYTENDI